MIKLRESLDQAERHAAEGQAVIDDHRAHVAKLRDQGQDAQDAEHLLRLFEAAQEALIAYRDCLRRLITNIEADLPQPVA